MSTILYRQCYATYISIMDDSQDNNDRWPDYLVEYAERRYRALATAERAFRNYPVGNPSWNIMLDLFVKSARGDVVSVTSATLASRYPPTTGLRHVHFLIEAGYVRRIADERDRRRFLLRLTSAAERAVAKILNEELEPSSRLPTSGLRTQASLDYRERVTDTNRSSSFGKRVKLRKR